MLRTVMRFACFLSLALVTVAAAEDAHRVEVLIEGGMALPLGTMVGVNELAAGDDGGLAERVMGAETGYTVGLRTRFFLDGAFSLAPSFTFVEFGDYDGYDTAGESYKIKNSLLRYGLDAQVLAAGGDRDVRPFFGVGAAVVRNRYRKDFVADEVFYEEGYNTFSWSLETGARWRDWELTLHYEGNSFTNDTFGVVSDRTDDGDTVYIISSEDREHHWNTLILRVGYRLPQF